jgi:hypothetical protein
MKYIIIKASWNTEYEALLFPEGIIHHPVAMSVGCMDDYEVISAGFCDKNYNAYGESTSMKRKSRPEEDTIILQRIFIKEFY